MPDYALGLMASEAAYGPSMHGSFAFFDLESCSWKTWQRSLDGGLIEFLETWPRAGTTLNGIAFRREPLAPRTSGTGCSLWDGEDGLLPAMMASLADKKGKDMKRRTRAGGNRGPDLQTFAILHPLPTLTANMGERGGRGGLHAIMNGMPNKHMAKGNAIAARAHFTDQLPNQIGGLLNPTWCEWYQGFPDGWSALDASETP